MDFKKKNVIATDAAQGIGRATAILLAELRACRIINEITNAPENQCKEGR